MSTIFLSHSSRDNDAAAEMKAWLAAEGHKAVFLDVDPEQGIHAGSNWEETLYHQLRRCQAVVALLTPGWLDSKWCFAEVVQARERGKGVFPVKVKPCDTVGVFNDLQHVDLTVAPEQGLSRLRAGLLARGLDPRDVFDWNPQRPPYPGLLAFQAADAAIFFGRSAEIVALVETLDGLRRQGGDSERFVLVLGASGSGKSSLLRAGVLPRLQKATDAWVVVPPLRPQAEPLDELATALAAAFQTHGRPRDWATLRDTLLAATAREPVDGRALPNLGRELALAAGQPEATVLLTIDQAEELYGSAAAPAAGRFLRLLRASLETAPRGLMVVATLRSDFLGEFQNHPAWQQGDWAHGMRYRAVPVDPVAPRSFAEIIRGPAGLVGLQLDDGLVEAMVSDTGTRDALPLLAFMLRRLYDLHGLAGRWTLAEYTALGRLEGAIRDAATRVIDDARPDADELQALHAAFVPAMVRITADGVYARRRALAVDLPPRASRLLTLLVDARLLVSDRDGEGRDSVEVAHEALLRTWPQLGTWLADDQDKLRLLEGLQRAAGSGSVAAGGTTCWCTAMRACRVRWRSPPIGALPCRRLPSRPATWWPAARPRRIEKRVNARCRNSGCAPPAASHGERRPGWSWRCWWPGLPAGNGGARRYRAGCRLPASSRSTPPRNCHSTPSLACSSRYRRPRSIPGHKRPRRCAARFRPRTAAR